MQHKRVSGFFKDSNGKFLQLILFSFLMLSHLSLGEPSCSRFHYEEQTLHKLVRLELEVEQNMKATKSVLEEIHQGLAEIRKERDEIVAVVELNQSEVTKKMEDMTTWSKRVTDDLADFKDRVTAGIEDQSTIPLVWFMAKDPRDTSPAKNQIIIYSTVVANEGNGYDATTGKFTAPFSGLYAFTNHACAYAAHGWHYAFMKNNVVMLSGRDYESDSGYPCASITTYTVLDAKDVVYIKVWYGGPHIQIHTSDVNFMNTFSGILVHN